eukprot:5303982-Alexandrium_andersonii.AAC.1
MSPVERPVGPDSQARPSGQSTLPSQSNVAWSAARSARNAACVRAAVSAHHMQMDLNVSAPI